MWVQYPVWLLESCRAVVHIWRPETWQLHVKSTTGHALGQLSMCSFLNRFSLWGIFTLFCGIYFFILLSLHLKPCCCLLFFSYLKVWHDANVGFLYIFLFQTSFQTIKTLIDEPQKRKIGSTNDSNLLDRESNCCVRVLLVRLHVLAIQTFFDAVSQSMRLSLLYSRCVQMQRRDL